MNLGKEIKLLRKEKGISQKKLAQLIGISQVSVNKIEKGTQRPSEDTIAKIVKALDTSLPFLVWRCVTIEDIRPERREVYLTLKPYIDSMIKDLS